MSPVRASSASGAMHASALNCSCTTEVGIRRLCLTNALRCGGE
jgi:hypothetical protein